MYKIKRNTEKRLSLVWETVSDPHWGLSMRRRGGYIEKHSRRYEPKCFGGIEFALNYLNSGECPSEPQYIMINGIKSPFNHWFEKV